MLFTVRLPMGTKTWPYDDLPMLIAEAKYGPREELDEAALELFGADWLRAESELEKAVKLGEVELVDSSFYPVGPPFTSGRLQRAAITVDALARYLERINGALELADPQPKETPDQRRARLAGWFTEEVKSRGERGAKQRVSDAKRKQQQAYQVHSASATSPRSPVDRAKDAGSDRQGGRLL